METTSSTTCNSGTPVENQFTSGCHPVSTSFRAGSESTRAETTLSYHRAVRVGSAGTAPLSPLAHFVVAPLVVQKSVGVGVPATPINAVTFRNTPTDGSGRILSSPRQKSVVGALQPMSLPPSSAPTATGGSDSCRAGFAPTGERRLSRRGTRQPTACEGRSGRRRGLLYQGGRVMPVEGRGFSARAAHDGGTGREDWRRPISVRESSATPDGATCESEGPDVRFVRGGRLLFRRSRRAGRRSRPEQPRQNCARLAGAYGGTASKAPATGRPVSRPSGPPFGGSDRSPCVNLPAFGVHSETSREVVLCPS